MKKLFIITLLLLPLLLTACKSEPEIPIDTPSHTQEEVINLVWAYAIPKTCPEASPTGEWTAIYEGNGFWRIVGPVQYILKHYDTEYIKPQFPGDSGRREKLIEVTPTTFNTIWEYNENIGQVHMTNYKDFFIASRVD